MTTMPGSTTRCASRYLFRHSTTAPVYRVGMMIRRYLGHRKMHHVCKADAAITLQQHEVTNRWIEPTAACSASLIYGHAVNAVSTRRKNLMAGLVDTGHNSIASATSTVVSAPTCGCHMCHMYGTQGQCVHPYTCLVHVRMRLLVNSHGSASSNAWLLPQAQQHLL
jgi:hypothetical protein